MDILHDNSHRIWMKLANEHEALIPDYVMNYTLPTKEAASEIEDDLFADSTRRLFPIDNAANTWLSGAYYAKAAMDGELPYKNAEAEYVQARLLKAAEVYDVAEEFTKISSAISTIPEEKQASDIDDNYGWVIKSAETGEVMERKYPMFDARGVEKAAEYFDTYRSRYPIGIRRHISRNILKKANEYGMDVYDLQSSVMREAGMGIPRKDVLMGEILERAHLTKDAGAAIALANINELLGGLKDSDIGPNLDKIAEVLEAFDSSADLTRYYNKKILMPSDFLFDIDIKQAEEVLSDAVELNKYVFSLSKLAELAPEVYETVLGEEFVKDVTVKQGESEVLQIEATKLADHLYSLPTPDRAALEEHLVNLFT